MRRGEPTHVRPPYEPLLRHLGFSPDWIFENPAIVAWRKLEDRENCTLDTAWADGTAVRLHIKRYPRRWAKTAAAEGAAFMHMEAAGIPCAPLVAWGSASDGRGFLITENLLGFGAADKLIEGGHPFEDMLIPTADLTARLHRSGLHHRDLYLCHFFIKSEKAGMQIKLIDAARVRPLPAWPRRSRWIVKDLAQFWYSTTKLPITDEQRTRWLARYVEMAGGVDLSIRQRIEGKVRQIAVHDEKLNRRHPARHVSIPKGES